MLCVSAVRLRLKLSAIAWTPSVVLKTSWIRPLIISSTISGRPSRTLLTRLTGSPSSRSLRAVPLVATSSNPQAASCRHGSTRASLSESRTETKTLPESGRSVPLPSCDLAKARPKSASNPMTSPVDFISGPRIRSTPGKRANGNTASLTATWPTPGRGRREPLAGHHPRRDLSDRHAGRLGDKGHGARGARVDFEHIHLAILDGELHIHQPDDIERAGER